MYATVVIQINLMYITFSTGQSTVSEGDDTCNAHHAIMDRIAAMEKMMINLIDQKISQTESKMLQRLEELETEAKNTKEKVTTIITRLDTIEAEMRQIEQEGQVTIKPTHDQSKDGVTMVRRKDGSISFERNWADYKSGFGDIGGDGELWLGLDKLHQLTSENEYGLNVTMATWDDKSFWAFYSQFSVGPESDNYKLSVSGYDVSSTAPDKLSYHSNMGFSTKDRDNDGCSCDCSSWHKGGWWYNDCTQCKPTGRYVESGVADWTGITWYDVPGYRLYYSFKEMFITLIRQ